MGRGSDWEGVDIGRVEERAWKSRFDVVVARRG